MRPLLIGPEEKAKIAALVKLAETNAAPYVTVKKLHEIYTHREDVDLGIRNMNLELTIRIPVDFQATYTHEEQRPGVMCRHLSVSVGPPTGKPLGPNAAAVDMLMQEFGFHNRLGQLLGTVLVWQEELELGRFAINVVEPLDGDLERLKQ